MPHIDRNTPGSFCWFELATTDQAAAKTFYTALFGWNPTDNEMGPGETYTIFQLNGRSAASAYAMRPEEQATGMPPHWNLYIAVESTDATAAKAVELGAKLPCSAFDVADHGRMAVVQDPQGAFFCLWQPINHPGLQVKGETGSLCWVDLNTTDQQAAKSFYGQLFGWDFPAGQDDYLHIKTGEEYIGGIPSQQQVQLPPGVPPHWLPYVQIDDCDASLAKAQSLGANALTGPMTMEGVGRFAVVADPQGAVFSLWQTLAQH